MLTKEEIKRLAVGDIDLSLLKKELKGYLKNHKAGISPQADFLEVKDSILDKGLTIVTDGGEKC